ncbi:ATP-binding cassette domain-containing protein [Silanimonas sp.]|uniref:amino acid ABC transporter ATP-binding/permease protein n=1 Tax=Silanimonas sp. TaxID=1929290 RepID=UPI0022C1A8D6|nr:ATP-binding cassette domain-containing protein [Silanimonas sp.]MCZ8062084.1 ATP-binding cassette domain-containing protein [Silanimonas sp.]
MTPRRYLWRLYRSGLGRWGMAWGFLALTWIAGAALLALSGWFIAASALAGLGLLVGLNIFTPSTAIRGLALVKPITRYAERVIGHSAVLHLLADLRVRLFTTVAATPALRWAAALGAERHADLVTRLMRDIDTLDGVPLRVVGPLLAAALTLLAAVVAMAHWGSPAMAAGLCIGGTAIGFVAFAFAARGRRRGIELVASRAALRVAHHDHFNGLAERLAYRKADHGRERLDALALDVLRRERRQEQWALLAEHGVQALVGLWLVAVVAIGWGKLDAASLALVALMTLGLGEAFAGVPGAWWRVGEAEASARRVMALESGIETVVETNRPGMPLTSARRRVLVIDGLRARHQPEEAPAWFATLSPGVPRVLHGPSGGGKSSLLATLAGELPPLGGCVGLDGVDWLNLSDAQRYARMAYLGQDDHLLDLTVRQFLSLGLGDVGDAALHRVLEAVALDSVFDRTGDGLDYRLGPRGSRVSGGQARRLQLAALLLRDPDLVILDEPFRGLDAAVMANLLPILQSWLEARCCLVVTHAPEALPSGWRRERWPLARSE